MEREKEKAKNHSQEFHTPILADSASLGSHSGTSANAQSDDHAAAKLRQRTSTSVLAHPTPDDVDMLRADIPNTVGSESSNASNASSRANAAAITKNSSSYSYVTPLTTIDSPSPPVASQSAKPETPNASHPTKINGSSLNPDGCRDVQATMAKSTATTHRIPARDPSLRVQVLRAVHDPCADRYSRDKKRPKYKEFGLVRKYIYSARLGERHLLLSRLEKTNKVAVYRKMTLPRRATLD